MKAPTSPPRAGRMAALSTFAVRRSLATAVVVALLVGAGPFALRADQVVLKDGRILRGNVGMVAGLAEVPQPPGPEGPIQMIRFVDDDLRRTFFSSRQVQEYRQDQAVKVVEKFTLRQPVMESGPTVKSVGAIVRITPFDEWGRRIFSMQTARGQVDVIQGITEVTPVWTKIRGLNHVWDVRLATSAIAPDVLHKILLRTGPPGDPELRKKIARFYVECERYEDATREIEAIVKEPAGQAAEAELAPVLQALRQLSAQRVLVELRDRRDAGQHRLVWDMLKAFPTEGVAGEKLQEVREMIADYEKLEAQRSDLLKGFDALVARIKDEPTRKLLAPIGEELHGRLNFNVLDRMAAFAQMQGDQAMLPEEKVSLAVSGWLLGADAATPRLSVSLSVHRVRGQVLEYLRAPDKLTQARIFEKFQGEEGATPRLVAKLLSHIEPPIETPAERQEQPGYFRLEVAGLPGAGPTEYRVQLPPEYDPLRRYPTIVTLNGAGTTPAQQIDWWAGDLTSDGKRRGQAARRGYIVVAPTWAAEHQRQYNYSFQEHVAVLNALRDACRRFSIDTDRVFLSGHSMGGDAAWDLGLAHPDLWAGVIPIVARSDRYCALYWENAKLVPYYFVCGELDGDKMVQNARDLDRYLKAGYNGTVVEYLGRGHEHFSDEILRLFDWMGRHRRNFFPKEFVAKTMRGSDTFFWWVELGQLPAKSLVDPADWPPPRGTLPAETKGTLTGQNVLYVQTGVGQIRVWLAPEMLDFDQRATISVNGKRIGGPEIQPSLAVLLEDVRTRGDRQHPFWARLDSTTGRVNAPQ